MMHSDLPEDLQHLSKGGLMGALGIGENTEVTHRPERPVLPHLALDPFDAEQYPAWQAAVDAVESQTCTVVHRWVWTGGGRYRCERCPETRQTGATS